LNRQGLQLSPEAKDLASLLAAQTYAKYKNVQGHYRNLANSHLVGKLGEIAAFIWFRDNDLNPTFNAATPGLDAICDIETDAGRCEVKTWSEHHWENLGRSVAVSQLKSVKNKADFIFWCSADEVDSSTPKVSLHGWSDVATIEQNKPTMMGREFRQVFNYQIPLEQLQPLDLLKQGNDDQGRNTQ